MNNIIKMEIRKSKLLEEYPESVYVTFEYSIKAVSKIKKLPDKVRRYIADKKCWEVSLAHLNELLELYSDFEVVLTGKAFTEPPQLRTVFQDNSLEEFNFKTDPFPHQIQGVLFGKDHDKFLLADEQGLGKTKQAIDLAVSRKGQFKHCLIVCGVNSVKYNWLQEIGIHSDEQGHILGSYFNTKGQLRDDGPMEYRLDDLNSDLDEFFLITNIETFRKPDGRRKESALSKMELTQKRIIERVEQLTRDGVIGMVIIDEVHKAKNPTSQQGKAIHHLKPHYKMALTGTPVMNSPLDVYNILKWLEVEDHPYHIFKKYYTESSNTWGDQLVFKNLSRLQELLDSVMLRRKKGDVLDLPPKLPQVIPLDMKGAQQKLYNGIRDELITKVDEIVLNPNPLAMLTRLRQVTSLPQVLTESMKESVKLEWIEEMLSTMVENGQKAIIFSNWSAVTRTVQAKLKHLNPAYIDGTVKDRMEQVNKFQNDDTCHVIIGTIGAMGTGLTLTAASNVIFIDEPWNPADKDQAEDRAHRIGTKGTVNIYTLVVRNSVDQRIRDLIIHKQDIIDGMVEGNFDKLNAIQFIKELLA